MIGHELDSEISAVRIMILRKDETVEGREEREAGGQWSGLPQMQVGHLPLLLLQHFENYY